MSQQEADDPGKGGGGNNANEEPKGKHQQPSVADSEEDGGSNPSAASASARKRMRTPGERKVTHQERWEEMFHRLKEFKRIHGHCRVPNRYPEDPPLGSWVSAQRRQYRIATTGDDGSAALTPDRANKLIKLGFEWACSNPNHTPWNTRYEALKEFIKRFGHAEVPMRWEENPKLSHWVSKQRHDMKLRLAGKTSGLTDEKVKLLNDVGFRWEGSRRSLQKKVHTSGSSAAATSLHAVSAEGGGSSIHEKTALSRQGAIQGASGGVIASTPQNSASRAPQGIASPNATGHSSSGAASSTADPQQLLALLNAFSAPAAQHNVQSTTSTSNNALNLSDLLGLGQQTQGTTNLQSGAPANNIQQLLNQFAIGQPAYSPGLNAAPAPDPPGATLANQVLSLLGGGNQAPAGSSHAAAGMQQPGNSNQLQQLLSLFGPVQQPPAQANTSHQAQTNTDALRQLSLLMGLSHQQQAAQHLSMAPSQGNLLGQLNYQGQGGLLSQLAAVSSGGNSVMQPLLLLPQSGLVPLLLSLQMLSGSVQSANAPSAGGGVGSSTVNLQGSAPSNNRADPSDSRAPDGSSTHQSGV